MLYINYVISYKDIETMHRCNYFDAICKQCIIYSVYKLEKKKHITII